MPCGQGAAPLRSATGCRGRQPAGPRRSSAYPFPPVASSRGGVDGKITEPAPRPELLAATGCLAAMLAIGCAGHALAWDQEGHSIIAEIAQRRLGPAAA